MSVHDSLVVGGIHQNITIGGQKYVLRPFQDWDRGIFPAFLAQKEHGEMYVAKDLDYFPQAEELNRDIHRMHLEMLPPGIARFTGCEMIGERTYLIRHYCHGAALTGCANRLDGNRERRSQETVKILLSTANLLMKRDVAHGGLSPSNIFLSGQGVSIADWGMDTLKDRIGDYNSTYRDLIESQRRESPYIAVRGNPLPPTERDAHALAVIGCELMGYDIHHLPDSLSENRMQMTRAAGEIGRNLMELLEDTVAGVVKRVIAFRNLLAEVAYSST